MKVCPHCRQPVDPKWTGRYVRLNEVLNRTGWSYRYLMKLVAANLVASFEGQARHHGARGHAFYDSFEIEAMMQHGNQREQF